jgi:ubiquinol-cytochrome c reductase cytochrome b subunit
MDKGRKQSMSGAADSSSVNIDNPVKRLFSQVRWGEYSLVALAISVLSGIVLSLQYDPAVPFYSVSSIDVLVPFGLFWRSLHFYSSQFFFLLSLLHFIAILGHSRLQSLAMKKWLFLVFSLLVALLLLFTGYVLRADATGESAGIIAENIILSIPLAGAWLNSLLFSLDADGVKRVYANHLIGLSVLWGVLCWDHLRRFRIPLKENSIIILGILAVSLFWNAPMEPEKLGVFHISGPWFFLGLQELLRYVQPFWAGVVFPLTFFLSLFFLRQKNEWGTRSRYFSLLWLAVYSLLTLAALMRS